MPVDDLTLVITVSLLAFIYLGWTHRTKDANTFHTDNREVGRVRTIASLFTVVGAPHFPIFTTLAYFYGWWPVAFYVGTLTGFIVLTAVASKIRAYGVDDAHSFADIAAIEVGKVPAFSLSLIAFVFTTGVIVTQIITGALLLSAISEMQYLTAVILIGATVLGYLFWGGYRALLFTDAIQGAMMLVFTVMLAVFLWVVSPDAGAQVASTEPGSSVPLMPLVPMLYLGGILVVLGAPEIWQRGLTTKTDDVATSSFMNSGIAMLFWGIMVVAIGNAIRAAHPTVDAGGAFVEVVTTGLPHWMVGLVVVLLLVALLSTADTELFAASVIAEKEFHRLRGTPDSPLEITKTRLIMTLLTAFALAGAVWVGDDLNTAFGVLVNLGYVAGPLALSVLLLRGGKTAAIRYVSFLACLISSLACFVFVWIRIGDFFSWWALSIMGTSAFRLLIPGAPAPRRVPGTGQSEKSSLDEGVGDG